MLHQRRDGEVPRSYHHLPAFPHCTARLAASPQLPPGSSAMSHQLHEAVRRLGSSPTSPGFLRDSLCSAGFPICVQQPFSPCTVPSYCPFLFLKPSRHTLPQTTLLGFAVFESVSGLMLCMCLLPAHPAWQACKPTGEARPAAAQLCQARHQAWSSDLNSPTSFSASDKRADERTVLDCYKMNRITAVYFTQTGHISPDRVIYTKGCKNSFGSLQESSLLEVLK